MKERTFQEMVDLTIERIRNMAMTNSDKVRLVCMLSALQTKYDLDMERNNRIETVDLNVFDEEEIHENCTVQILKNSSTGEVSVGWWENEVNL